ncbi:testis-specific serine/threonine-protein kinase 3-like [Littorina saxatilis]|uniref:mitogen-activated protein kinase kinase n=1 Tax=Littorina saxatilis TaxID=31220 RepID=A0AAN9BUQ0_9CAEN
MEYVKDPTLWEDFLLTHGYELLGQLDCGGFSDVFAVSSVRTGSVVAVKRIVARRSVMADPRVAAEISSLTRLRMRGSCVIGLEEAVVRDGVACLVLELAPLGDLERYVTHHWPLPHGVLTCCARQVTTALTHCHRLHVAHRDLHPANVLLLSPRRVRLADFGLAVRCRDSAGRPLLCDDYLGREAYLAPEVLTHTPYDALQADLWSLGKLCQFLSTGKHPPPDKPCPPCLKASAISHPTSSECSALAHKTNSLSPSSRHCQTHSPFSITHITDPHLSQRTTDSVKVAPLCRSVKGFLPVSPRSKRYRASSCDSESSCRSESDTEELSSPHRSTPQSGTKGLHPPHHFASDYGSRDSSLSSFGGHGHCQEPQEDDPISWTLPASNIEVFEEQDPVSRALAGMVFSLCVYDPLLRLCAEDALEMWKLSVKKVRKS